MTGDRGGPETTPSAPALSWTSAALRVAAVVIFGLLVVAGAAIAVLLPKLWRLGVMPAYVLLAAVIAMLGFAGGLAALRALLRPR